MERPLEGLRILVVDDIEDQRLALRLHLEFSGATVIEASSGQEALSVLDREWPDVLVSDIAMPGGDGIDLIQKIRAREDVGSGRMLALATTALPIYALREEPHNAGFDGVVVRPYEVDHLISKMTSLLNRPIH